MTGPNKKTIPDFLLIKFFTGHNMESTDHIKASKSTALFVNNTIEK